MLASVGGKSPFRAVKEHLGDLLAIQLLLLPIFQFFLFLVFFLLYREFKLFGRGVAHRKRKLGLVLRAGEHFVHGLYRSGGG